MKYLLFFCCCVFFMGNGLAQGKAKRTKKTELQQEIQLDSLKRKLAEARRARQQCEEQFSGSAANMQAELTQLRNAYAQSQKKLAQQQQTTQKLTDSLKQSQQAFATLQQDWAKREMRKDQQKQQLMNLQRELRDSLKDYVGAQLQFVLDDDRLRLEVGDSILFGGYYYVLPRGKKFLEAFLVVLEKHPNSKLHINCAAGKSIVDASQWRVGMTKSNAIGTVLYQFKLKASRIEIAARNKDDQNKFPPVFLEIMP